MQDDLIQRKVLLRDLKNRIGQLRSQFEFDTSIASTFKKKDVTADDAGEDLEKDQYKGYCLRNNGTVYKTIYENNCVNNKEISHQEYLNIVNSVLAPSPDPSTSSDDDYDELEERLTRGKSLYEKGLITKQEYDDKRKEILDAY